MNAKREERRNGNIHRFVLLAALLLLMVLVAGCDPEVAETGIGYKVRRVDPDVYATTDKNQPNTLLRLTNDDPHDLEGRRMVSTENNGQALIWSSICKGLYLYGDSKLVLSDTPRGGGTGADAVGAGTSDNCDISIRTMPSDVSTSGTWFSFSYIEHLELVMIFVGEGTVTVTPTTKLDYKLVDPELLEYEVAIRDMGDAKTVTVDQSEAPSFYFTAPDDQLAELGQLGELPADRTWLELDELPALRLTLHEVEPQLEVWLVDIWERARLDALPIPELIPIDELRPPTPGEALSVIVAGEHWYDERLLDAITLAVEWNAVLEGRFNADQPLDLMRLENLEEPMPVRRNLSASDYDPDAARRMIDEAGFGDYLTLVLMVPPDDIYLDAAHFMADQLMSAGVKVDIVDIPLGEEGDHMKEAAYEGLAVIWIGPQ